MIFTAQTLNCSALELVDLDAEQLIQWVDDAIAYAQAQNKATEKAMKGGAKK